MKRHKTQVLAGCIMAAFASVSASAHAISQLCTPKITANEVVASPKQRYDAGQKAEPSVTDNNAFFAWPDTPMGIIKTANGYEFFGSDGGFHSRQMWQGHWVGNNKWGSVVTTAGTLGNPLGTGDPQDVSISPNPDPAVNPNYSSYQYMGGGPTMAAFRAGSTDLRDSIQGHARAPIKAAISIRISDPGRSSSAFPNTRPYCRCRARARWWPSS